MHQSYLEVIRILVSELISELQKREVDLTFVSSYNTMNGM